MPLLLNSMWARRSDDSCNNSICKPLVADLDGALMSSDLQIRDLTVGFPARTLFRAPDMDVPAGTSMSGALNRVRAGNPTVRSRIWRSLDISAPSKSATKGLQIELLQLSSERLAHIELSKRGTALLIDYSIS